MASFRGLLLDTHVIVWLFEGIERLRSPARHAIDRAARDGTVFMSAISFWEVAMLCKRGHLSLASTVERWRDGILSSPGVAEIPIGGEVAIASVNLPGSFHADPADRLIVATARTRGLQVVTADKRILAYAKRGEVAALAAG